MPRVPFRIPQHLLPTPYCVLYNKNYVKLNNISTQMTLRITFHGFNLDFISGYEEMHRNTWRNKSI
jgi:hypothetical protein